MQCLVGEDDKGTGDRSVHNYRGEALNYLT